MDLWRFPLLLVLMASAVLGVSAYSTEEDVLPDFEFILGPRVGVKYLNMSQEDFSEEVSKLANEGDYYPVVSLFGASLEQRILLGSTRSHFSIQEVALVGGLEQSIAIPSLLLLIGYRAGVGFEFGAGTLIGPSGAGVLLAVGWTFAFSDVFVPVDISVTLPNNNIPLGVAITTGFNFRIYRS